MLDTDIVDIADAEEKRRAKDSVTETASMTRVVYTWPVVEQREIAIWVPPMLLTALKTHGCLLGKLTHVRPIAEIEEGADIWAPYQTGYALTVKRDGLVGALIFVPGVAAEDLL